MKATLLSTTFVLACATSFAQVPNGGFENWADVGGYDDPVQWVSFNSMTFMSGVGLSCEQGTPGAVGNSYAKVTSLFVTGAGVVPGTLYSAADPINAEGFPHAQRSASLTGQWKYAIQAGDQGGITVAMKKYNTVTHVSDVIGVGEIGITGSQAAWQSFSVPITYFNALVPDTALIYVLSSASAGVDGSTVSVDDLAFGAATGVEEATAVPTFELYPTSATDVVRIDARERIASVSVIDVRGRAVKQQGITDLPYILDVTDLQTGSYLVTVSFADGRRATRPLAKL